MSASDNKRIAKNTLFLYFRMLLTMGVSLYTSRIVLDVLGVENYGIYNVVGGIIILFSFINGSMSATTQRFLSFEIGTGNKTRLKQLFNASLMIHLFLAFIIVIISETAGLWFLNTQLNIPSERMFAANWVFHVSVFSSVIMMTSIPFNALIIAHEKMKAFAYISIVDVLLKLVAVYLLYLFKADKLILYSVLILIITILNRLLYNVYCLKQFKESHFELVKNTSLYKELTGFASWSLFGALANVGKQQGITIVINIFFGVTVNAALAIANQINSALTSFVSNFQVAFNPQIVKSYANNDDEYLKKLIFKTSRFCFLLLYFLSFPILIYTKEILFLWLKIVPEYAVIFSRLIIIYSLIETLSAPLWITIQATGKIKQYQIIISSLLLLNIPISFIFLKLNFEPTITLIIMCIIGTLALFVRLVFLKKLVSLSSIIFFKEVGLKIMLVILLSTPILFISRYITFSGFKIMFSFIITLLLNSIIIYRIGLIKDERKMISNKIKKILKK